MMKVFLDTNIMIYLLAERKMWLLPAMEILELTNSNKIDLFCSIISLPTVSYIMERQAKIPHDIVISKMERLVNICEPIYADKQIALRALNSSFKDFEDAMQYYSAIAEGCDVIITRNKKDFSDAHIDVMDPQEFLDKFYGEN